MRKAQRQFQEILNLNPEDLFQVRHYLMSIALYFEELESCRELLDKYRRNENFKNNLKEWRKVILYFKVVRDIYIFGEKRRKVKKMNNEGGFLKSRNSFILFIIM